MPILQRSTIVVYNVSIVCNRYRQYSSQYNTIIIIHDDRVFVRLTALPSSVNTMEVIVSNPLERYLFHPQTTYLGTGRCRTDLGILTKYMMDTAYSGTMYVWLRPDSDEMKRA